MKQLLSWLAAVLVLTLAVPGFAEVKPNTLNLTPFIGGYTFDGVDHLETQPVYGIRLGYDFTKNWGVEGYFDYAATSDTRTDQSINFFRYGADALYYLMPDKKLVPYVAAGFGGRTINTRGGITNVAFTGPMTGLPYGYFQHDENKNSGLFDYGIGLKYFVNDWLALRGDFRHIIAFDRAQMNYEYGVGLNFMFDMTPAPTPPAPPCPQPVVKQEPPPPPPRYKYCTTMNPEFDICKTEIRPEYHNQMAKAGKFMQQYPDTTAIIEGHTDNVPITPGPHCQYKDNMELSQARAESAVNYLVEKFGIDRSRLTAKGYGDTRPIADNATNEGRQKNRRIDAIVDCAILPEAIKPDEELCMTLAIEFDTGKADIKPRYRDLVANVADYLKKYPDTKALIEGHTDNVGSDDVNMKLSQQRAESVVNYLVQNFGIDRSRLTAKGYGSTRPIAYNTTPEGRQKNRRIDAVIDCVPKK